MSLRVYRVTVRGQFDDLSEDQRRVLAAHAEQHDVLAAEYTRPGTFVYDTTLGAFSFRYEVRVDEEDKAHSDGQAAHRALALAESYLDEVGLPRKRLRASITDMADVWD